MSDTPLDLGPIEPGEHQEWRPGWTGLYDERPMRQAVPPVAFEISREAFHDIARSIMWDQRARTEPLVDWPADQSDAESITHAVLEALGVRVKDA